MVNVITIDVIKRKLDGFTVHESKKYWKLFNFITDNVIIRLMRSQLMLSVENLMASHESKKYWKLLNVITDTVIIWLIKSELRLLGRLYIVFPFQNGIIYKLLFI